MNLKTKKIKSIAMMSVLLFSFGCQKETDEVIKTSFSNNVEVGTQLSNEELNKLIEYLSVITQIDKKELSYNSNDEQFYFNGVAQVNLYYLRLSYSQKNK